jgi:hypothetical protein
VRPDPGGAFDDSKLTGFGCFSPNDKVSDWIADGLAEGPRCRNVPLLTGVTRTADKSKSFV